MPGTLLPIGREDVERYSRAVNEKIIEPFHCQSNDQRLLSEATS